MNRLTADRIYIATFSRAALNVSKQYNMGLEINDLCISSNLNPENRERVLNKIKREIETVYGDVWFHQKEDERRKVIFHGPFTELTPSSIDERAIDLMNERYKETVEICKHFSAKDLVLHDGFIPLIYSKDWQKKKSVDYWKGFSDELPEGFTVYIENVFDDEPELLTEIVSGVDRANIKICLDVGHANCMMCKGSNINYWLETMKPYIGHFHIHNNDGSGDLHNDINEGTLNIDEVLAYIQEYLSSNVTVTVESREALPSAEYLFLHIEKQ